MNRLSLLAIAAFSFTWVAPASADEEPRLPEAPPNGVDPDVEQAMDEARQALEHRDYDEASRRVLDIHLATDRFTSAQAKNLLAPSIDYLRRAGRAQISAGKLELGVTSLDAAWLLDGKRPAPEYAQALVVWADQKWSENKGEALYLVRKATLADPTNADAKSRDESWSSNRLSWVGWTLTTIGFVGLASWAVCGTIAGQAKHDLSSARHSREEADALIEKQRLFGLLSGIGLGVGITGVIGGPVVFAIGSPDFRPTPPPSLPALKDTQ